MSTLAMVTVMMLLPGAGESRSSPDESTLLLDVFVNGQNIGKIAEFVSRDGDLLATRNELRSLGFRVQADLTDRATGRVIGRPEMVSLKSLTGVTWRIDGETQSIYLGVPLVRLLNTAMGDDTPARLARRERPESSRGVTMNYDTTASLSQGVASASALLELRQYSSLGAFSSGFVTYTNANPFSSGHLIRLDTNFTRANPASMLRFTVGDFVSGSLAWTRPVRLEGVQIRSDFSTRPDVITFPLPTLHSSVAVPSSIEVFNDSGQAYSGQVSAGAFQVPQVPTVSGAGTIVMSVTDATGKQVITRQAFYASPSLLRPGLQSYSLEAGRTRLNWGLHSEDFGSPAAIGTYRRGMTPSFTAEATAQVTSAGGMAGVGGVFKLGNIAVFDAAAAASGSAAGGGTQLSLSLERKARFASMAASYLVATAPFSDVASLNGDATVRSQLTLSGSLATRSGASIGALFSDAHRDPPLVVTSIGAPTWSHSKTVALTYTQQMHAATLYVNSYADLANHALGLLAGVVIPLGHRTAVNVSAGYGGTPTQFQVSKSAADVGESGFQAFADTSSSQHIFGDVERRTEHGFITAGIDSSNEVTTLRTTTSGSISAVDGSVFLANRIQDSFAVVDLSGLADVRVLDEQRVVGRSDRHGRLLVPDLRSYEANHLSLDAADVPLDVTLTETMRTVRPRDRSGVVVHFATADNHVALVAMTNTAGEPVPIGSVVQVVPTGEKVPVGYDGFAFLENLNAINRVKVQLPDGSTCFSEFKYVHFRGVVSKIGPLPCS